MGAGSQILNFLVLNGNAISTEKICVSLEIFLIQYSNEMYRKSSLSLHQLAQNLFVFDCPLLATEPSHTHSVLACLSQ